MVTLKSRALGVCVSLIFMLLAQNGRSQGRIITLDTGTKTGLTNVVKVLLNAQGNENAVGFSLSFDPQLMQFIGATVGSGASGASINVNSSNATNGAIGVALEMPFGQDFVAGTRECARLNFVPKATGTSSLTFTDSPIIREISDDTAKALSATFVDTNIAVVYVMPPSVAIQPASQTIVAGSNVTFSVVASGTPPFGYQWRKNGSNVSGATDSALTRSSITTNDAGSYSAVVTNLAGTVTSADAALFIIVPGPVQLLSMVANPDSTVTSSWSSTPGVYYTLQYKSNLLDTQWTAIGEYPASSNSLTLADNPGAANQRFYRLSWSIGASSPAGFVKLPLPGNSDTYVSLPFMRPAAVSMIISSVSVNTISVSGSPNWLTNQFVYAAAVQTNTYYARFASGALEGHLYPISANGNNTVTLDLGTDSLATAVSGDAILIEPYWTLATVFPNGKGVNISPTLGNRNSEVLIPDLVNAGINLSSSKIYFFHNGLWKIVGQGNTDHGTDILQPNAHFIIRHNVATNTTLIALGNVVGEKMAVPLRAYAGNRQDNTIGLARPVTLSLDASQLVSGGGFASSPLPGTRTDELIVFDNVAVQHNKSAAAIYYYWSGGWRRVGAGATLVGTDPVFAPGVGVIIRKNTNNAASLWINSPGY